MLPEELLEEVVGTRPGIFKEALDPSSVEELLVVQADCLSLSIRTVMEEQEDENTHFECNHAIKRLLSVVITPIIMYQQTANAPASKPEAHDQYCPPQKHAGGESSNYDSSKLDSEGYV